MSETSVVLDQAAEDRAKRALYEYAIETWGWGAREYEDVVRAVEVVFDAVEAT